MTDYTYSRVAALNFTTTPVTVGRSATGSVYAVGDTTYTTPLTVTMVVGGATGTSISSDANGFFPDFTVANRTSVVFKQTGTSFTSVLTTTDPVPGPQGTPGTPGATGATGPRGDLATWQASTFYPLNQVISNPTGDLVKVTTAHTSGASYDATKFDYVVPPSLTPAALSATILDEIETEATDLSGVLRTKFVRPLSLFSARRIGWAGDSVTVGSGATSTSKNFVTQAVRIAGSARAVTTVNGGVAGERSDQLLARVPAILAAGIDHMHIQIGTNDASQAVPVATYAANIQAMVDLARAADVTVSIGLVYPRGSAVASSIHQTTRIYNLWLQSWCPKQGVLLADTFTPLADPVTGYMVAGLDSDGTHPNNAGHLEIAKAVAPVVIARQFAMPWPVTSVSPIGLVGDPLMTVTTNWADMGGTGTAVKSILAGDGIDPGNEFAYQIDNTAGGASVYRQTKYVLDATKYSAGDELLIHAMVRHNDTTDAAGVKIQTLDGSTTITIPLDTAGSVHNPGPIQERFTVPASPGAISVSMTLTAPAGMDVTAYIRAFQVHNLTTGGLDDLV